MENQYTYYKPEPDDMNGMNEETPKPKKNRKVPKPVKLVCAGVAFGLPDRKLCGNKSVRHNNYKR